MRESEAMNAGRVRITSRPYQRIMVLNGEPCSFRRSYPFKPDGPWLLKMYRLAAFCFYGFCALRQLPIEYEGQGGTLRSECNQPKAELRIEW